MSFFSNNQSVFLYGMPVFPDDGDMNSDIKFLPLKKWKRSLFKSGDIVLLYCRKNKRIAPGIIGHCKISGSLVKTSDISREQRVYCINRAYLQLPIERIYNYAHRNYMDEDIFYSLPQMNSRDWGNSKVYRDFSLININPAVVQAMNNYCKYWYIWKSQNRFLMKGYESFYLHNEREIIDFDKYIVLSDGVTKCNNCGIYHTEFKPFF
jgi:hypothetical protein